MSNQPANPAQWPTFGHVGVWLAEHSARKISLLTVSCIYIQRWWRQRSQPRQQLYPIVIQKWAHNVTDSVLELLQPQALEQPVAAYEKLDGTNLGVRSSDGAVFGRRYQVQGNSYCKVMLPGTIPTQDQVRAVQSQMAQRCLVDKHLFPPLVLYGELMCNPTKFAYDERAMAKFLCFGAVLDPSSAPLVKSDELVQELNRQGFLATLSSKDKIKIRMNDQFAGIVTAQGISCAPLLDQGNLRDVCFRIKPKLMKNDMEGVVLAGKHALLKWKTGLEDESKSHDLLQSLLQSYSPTILEMARVDVELIQLLTEVAKHKKQAPRSLRKKKKVEKEQAYDQATLDKALASAMSKYDALDAYFERSERDWILAHLKAEIIDDLEACTDEQIKCIGTAVGKTVGAAFGKWKQKPK